MLVLSRKKAQSIIINDQIEVTIMEISNELVKVGISAPKNVSIFRKEIYEKIKSEMKDAARSPLPNIKFEKKTKNDRENQKK